MTINVIHRFPRSLVALALLSSAANAQFAPNDPWQPTKRWHRIDAVEWKVAPRHQPFTDRWPEEMRVRQAEGKVILRKTGGAHARHICPDRPLQAGERMRIVYSLTEAGRGGGTPVPYFGLRDRRGQECVLFMFESFPRADEVHEIVVQRSDSGFRASRDQRVVDRPEVGPDFRNLTDPVYVFFHMNDTSEVVIHELATAKWPEPPEVIPDPFAGQDCWETRHPRCRVPFFAKLRALVRRGK